jgi:hypothetical protein
MGILRQLSGRMVRNGCETPRHSGLGLAICHCGLWSCLLLIRGVFIGITRGFGAGRSQAFWILLGYLLFVALAIYLFDVGRPALSIAKGCPRPKARFGWGRILLGSIFLYSSSVDHFHLISAPGVNHLESTNETEALGMTVTAIVIALGCILLIVSGMWRGFRPHRTSAGA